MRLLSDEEKREQDQKRLEHVRKIAPKKDAMRPVIEALMEQKISAGKAMELCAEIGCDLPPSGYIHASGEPTFDDKIALLTRKLAAAEKAIEAADAVAREASDLHADLGCWDTDCRALRALLTYDAARTPYSDIP